MSILKLKEKLGVDYIHPGETELAGYYPPDIYYRIIRARIKGLQQLLPPAERMEEPHNLPTLPYPPDPRVTEDMYRKDVARLTKYSTGQVKEWISKGRRYGGRKQGWQIVKLKEGPGYKTTPEAWAEWVHYFPEYRTPKEKNKK